MKNYCWFLFFQETEIFSLSTHFGKSWSPICENVAAILKMVMHSRRTVRCNRPLPIYYFLWLQFFFLCTCCFIKWTFYSMCLNQIFRMPKTRPVFRFSCASIFFCQERSITRNCAAELWRVLNMFIQFKHVHVEIVNHKNSDWSHAATIYHFSSEFYHYHEFTVSLNIRNFRITLPIS